MKLNLNSFLLVVGLILLTHRGAYGAAIVYFEHANYGGSGNILGMEPGVCYNLSAFNDRISSIQAPSCVYAYEHAGCHWNDGRHRQIPARTAIPNLGDFNDIISSFLLC